LRFQPITEEAIEAHKQSRLAGMSRPARVLQCEHCFASARCAVKKATRVLSNKIERIKLLLGKLDQPLFRLFDLRSACNDGIEVRPQELNERGNSRSFGLILGFRSIQQFTLFVSEAFYSVRYWSP